MINEQDFISYLSIKQGSSSTTVRHCVIRLRVVLRFLTETNSELNSQTVEKFFYALKERGLSNAALNTYLLCFKYLEDYYKDRGSPTSLLSGIKAFPKIRQKPIEILTEQQVRDLLAVDIHYKPFRGKDTSFLNTVYKTFTTSLAFTGARFDEMASLKVMYVDLTWGRILFPASTTKTKTERSLFITEPLTDMLKVLLKNKNPQDLVFQNMMGNKIREQEYSKDIKERGRLAKIDKRVHPHLLRHTYATHLYMATRDIGLVQVVLGHKDIKSTMIYVQIADEVIRNGMYTHPFIRQHVKPDTTIQIIEKNLQTLKLDEDPRFDRKKVRTVINDFVNNLYDAAN